MFFKLILLVCAFNIVCGFHEFEFTDLNSVLNNPEQYYLSCCQENVWNETFFREIFDQRRERNIEFLSNVNAAELNPLDCASDVSTFAWKIYNLVNLIFYNFS